MTPNEYRYFYAGLSMLGLIIKATDSIDTRQIAIESLMLADALIERLHEKEEDKKHPLLDKGYFRITAYYGDSKYIQVGKIYKGSARIGYNSQRWLSLNLGLSGYKPTIRDYQGEWEIVTKEEYDEQQKKGGRQ